MPGAAGITTRPPGSGLGWFPAPAPVLTVPGSLPATGLLQGLLSTLGDFGQIHVVRAIDEVRLQLPEECGTSLWSLFPSSGSHEDCGAAGNTGVNPEGFLVVSWQEEHLPWDNAVCWVLPEGSDVWEYYYVQEAAE